MRIRGLSLKQRLSLLLLSREREIKREEKNKTILDNQLEMCYTKGVVRKGGITNEEVRRRL